MTTLLINPLGESLSQDYFLSTDRLNLASIAPYLYLHNSPAGTFTFEVIKNSEVIFTKNFSSLDIKNALETTDDYAHVFYPFVVSDSMPISKGLFTFKLSATGYSFAGSSFLGWVQEFENESNPLGYEPSSDNQLPLAIRFKELKEGVSIG